MIEGKMSQVGHHIGFSDHGAKYQDEFGGSWLDMSMKISYIQGNGRWILWWYT